MSGCCCAEAAVERHATAAKARAPREYFMGLALHDRRLTSYQSRQGDAIRSFVALGSGGARQSRRISAKRSRRESPVWVKSGPSRRSARMSDFAESGHSARQVAMSGIRQMQSFRRRPNSKSYHGADIPLGTAAGPDVAMKWHTREVWWPAIVARNPACPLSGFGIGCC